MRPARRSSGPFRTRAARAVLLAAVTLPAGCGARGGLLVDHESVPGAAVQDAAAPDQAAPEDAAVADAPPLRCPSLVQNEPPVRVLGIDGLHYVGPIALARAGGFDVVTFQNNGPGAPSHAAVAVRATLPSSDASLVWGYPVTLDEEATTIGEAAAFGELVGSCRGAVNIAGDRVLTFQTHDSAYAMHGQRRISSEDPRCFAIAGHDGRWVAFWLGEPGYPATTLVRGEFDDTAEVLAAPTAVTDIGNEVRATAYGRGLAFSGHGASTVSLTFLPDDGAPSTVQMAAEGTIGSVTPMVPWPWRDDAVGLIWEEATANGAPTTIRLQAVSQSGETIVRATLNGSYPYRAIPALASMSDRLIVMTAEYDGYGADTGVVRVAMIGEDSAAMGAPVALPFERGDLNDQHDVSVAATDDRVLIVWAVRPGLANAGVWAAELACGASH